MAPTFFQAAFTALLALSSVVPSEAGNTPLIRRTHERHDRLHLHQHAPRKALHVSHQNVRRDLTIPANLPSPWTSMGCYKDNEGGSHTLTGAQTGSNTMTIEACISYCSGQGYSYAGVEYSQECFCGNKISAASGPAPDSDCNMACAGDATEPCGGPNRLNLFWNHATPPSDPVHNPGPPGWQYSGCYTEGNGGRALANGVNTQGGASKLTVALCVSACKDAGYKIAGVEYSGECYCDNTFQNGAAPAPNGQAGCNMLCNGNQTEYCGGPGHLDVYSVYVPPPAPAGWVNKGCYSDQDPRTLRFGANGDVPGGAGNMTVENCQAACKKGNYVYAGLEYSGECWCDNVINAPGGPASDGDAQCTMTCNGNTAQKCGGPNRLNVYQYSNSGSATTTSGGSTPTPSGPSAKPTVGDFGFVGCYTEATNARALTGNTLNANDMTLEKCATACSTFQYFGVEYGTECYCGNTLGTGSISAANQKDCSFLCPGDQTEYCGAGNRLNLYQKGAVASTTGTSSAASSTTTTSSSAPTTTNTGLPVGWKYGGCYSEGIGGRAIANQQPDSNTLTIESCVATCAGLGYSVAGAEYASQCFCGNKIANGGTVKPETDCSMACSGNPTEKCGAGGRLSVYYTGNLTTTGVPKAQTDNLPGSWKYQGCLQDNVNNNGRNFFWQIIDTKNNSATNCLTACSNYGYMAGGMEYSEECYCGDAVDVSNHGAVIVDDSQCDDPCPGNDTTICGGGNRLSYYQWIGEPLYKFGYPTGSAAGKYEMLIGGVVVPLQTTLGINGKYTFLEKHGTGALNSTGAYELDPAYINDFSSAWRTMNGIKTDIFCAAGITLPDKAGRQLNVGGWSGESTYGVRLYWPDGSPGVQSNNDWHENYNKLHLQKGRWYPTAMMMTNGSVLVVGGEEGSNGAPVPSLEILPQVGPVIDVPFLRSTDPYSLYPFLVTLPSGKIFIAAYNEAQLLDPVSLSTVGVLPKIPGAVNINTGGRTYPLEGTMMVMPQVAPYSDPLTVLLCGGSTPGVATPLDNCVSIQPEGASPKWTLERMPSQRVISCMTALPDGTYMILNGAHKGVAGFGLASDPNLNAVLYDPSKPVNQRMSVMANTTIARLYHSEAILMQDGRVMVSGSNPQDDVNPEEYRVEVFSPPYALNGLAKPTFQLTNKDWAYGQQVQISVNAPSGGTIRVSLMGAETSTHGNTMGQRTIFPALSCSGGACTITAPPNGNTCPPGWYQVFVLDGPTPSMSQFVRIGGDPGQLGNWPNLPDFQVPGI